MYHNQKIAVVVPAYNEEKLIGKVIETMPKFVDAIVVVDDKSLDNTRGVVEAYKQDSDKIKIICHKVN